MAALLLAFCFAAPLAAQSKRLYLKGGGDMIVSEYEVLEDRVRYHSVERNQWEEIPLELVDLEKTGKESEFKQKVRDQRRRETQIEYEAEQKARTELHLIPVEDGVYHKVGDNVSVLPQATVLTEDSAKRKILQVILPIPVVAGKSTVEIEGATSPFVVHEAKPTFFLREPKLSRFGIVRIETKKDRRLVQTIQIVPQSKEMFEEHDEVEVFRQQLASKVYKVWPVEALTPGEYALIDYIPGEAQIRVWDFSYQPQAE